MRAAIALLIVGALSVRPAAVGDQASAGGPSATPARLVTIDLVATDARGRAIESLTAADFELAEEGTPLALESVRFVRAGAGAPERGGASAQLAPAAQAADRQIQTAADERQAASRDEARLFAIFLDEYHVQAGANADRVRESMLRFVDRDLAAGDLVVVLKPL